MTRDDRKAVVRAIDKDDSRADGKVDGKADRRGRGGLMARLMGGMIVR